MTFFQLPFKLKHDPEYKWTDTETVATLEAIGKFFGEIKDREREWTPNKNTNERNSELDSDNVSNVLPFEQQLSHYPALWTDANTSSVLDLVDKRYGFATLPEITTQTS